MKKTSLGSLLCLTLLALCTLGFAADKPSHPGYAAGVVQKGHPYVDPDAGIRKLFSNFGPDPADLYDASNGYFVSGANNAFNGQMQDIAIPFVAPADATVVGVKYAIQEYLEIGHPGFKASFNADAGGLPGASLASARRLLKNHCLSTRELW